MEAGKAAGSERQNLSVLSLHADADGSGRYAMRPSSSLKSSPVSTPLRQYNVNSQQWMMLNSKIKRSQTHSGMYELSDDLQAKQVEMLERKYGGHHRTKHAALVIQQAFRRYSMERQFQNIRRLSRRHSPRFYSMQEPTFLNGSQSIWEWGADNTLMQTALHNTTVVFEKPDFASLPKTNLEQCVSEYSKTKSMSLDKNMRLNSSFENERVKVDSSTSVVEHVKVTHVETSSVTHTVTSSVEETSNKKCDQVKVKPVIPVKPVVRPPIKYKPFVPESKSRSHSSSETSRSELGDKRTTRRYGRCLSDKLPSTVASGPSALHHKTTSGEGSRLKHTVHRKTVSRTDSFESKALSGIHPSFLLSLPHGFTSESGGESSQRSESEDDIGYECRDIVSPVWKRKSPTSSSTLPRNNGATKPVSLPASKLAEVTNGSATLPKVKKELKQQCVDVDTSVPPVKYRVTDVQRKRYYRVGLNLFNRKPDRGLQHLIDHRFVEGAPSSVAKFLIARKGLSRQKIGEFLGSLQKEFNMKVLSAVVDELDFSGMEVDEALRHFQSHFRMPGEAQKIERLMEAFGRRYCECNPEVSTKLQSEDTVFVLAFAIIMLNTDLHSPNVKPERKMSLEDFTKNLKGVDNGQDLDADMLAGVYERIKKEEFKTQADHVSQVLKVEHSIVGSKKPMLSLPHRRLVCYCRLYEVPSLSKRDKPGLHQREIFLFNDVIVVTKIFSKKKGNIMYGFRQSYPLHGLQVETFETNYYKAGLRLSQAVDGKTLIVFNSKNENDRSKFTEDLRESILEMNETESLRIEDELHKHKMALASRKDHISSRDSGVVADDGDLPKADQAGPGHDNGKSASTSGDKRTLSTSLSNSLLELSEQQSGKPKRRGSAGSLDSGMSSTSSLLVTAQHLHGASAPKSPHQSFKFGSIFGKRGGSKKAAVKSVITDSTEV